MKTMRKIIPALCLLLVSAILMGTSTYAWYAMNTSVEASGMKVQAATSKNLVISKTSVINSTDEGAKVESDNSGTKTLDPASISQLAASPTFYKLTATGNEMAHDKHNGNIGTEYAAVTEFITDSTKTTGHVAKYTFYIRTVAEDDEDYLENLYVNNISIKQGTNTPSEEISRAIRVGVVCTTGAGTDEDPYVTKAYIYVPIATTNTSDKGYFTSYAGINAAGIVTEYISSTGIYYKGEEGSRTAMNATTTFYKEYPTANKLADKVVTSKYVAVDIYIWYEGEDPNCTSKNSIDAETLSVSVYFTATKPTSSN